jgi:Tfp pilus assembly protein PilV
VEVLIAMMVLSIGILALTLMMKQSVSSTDYGRRVTTAENLALQKMEDLKSSDSTNKGYYNTPAKSVSASGSPPTYATITEDYGQINGYPDYQRKVDCVILSGYSVSTPNGYLKRVTVTVSWRSVGSIGQGGSVSLVTIMSP